jgi:peptide/nickel transport system substrate-binding protein
LISIVAMMIIVIPLIAPMVNASQPPIETDVFYTGTIGWGPGDADPAIVYDTASGELLFNVYQGLMAAKDELYYEFVPVLSENVPTRVSHTLTVTNASAVGEDPTGSNWTGPGPVTYRCVGYVDEGADGFHAGDALYLTDETTWRTYQIETLTGTSLLVMNVWYGSYTFLLRSHNTTINFYDYTGAVADTFDVVDAEYSFERDLTIDVPGQPIWMFDKPFFDLPDHSYFTNDTAIDLAHLIDDCIEGDVPTQTLTINVGVKFPDNAFKQIFINTWGSIYSKEYAIGLGNWDGDLYAPSDNPTVPLWWIIWAGEGGGIDQYTQDPLNVNAEGEVSPELYCGTGPYHVASIDSTGGNVVLERNPGFWMGWPMASLIANGYCSTINIRYIADWNTRKTAFQNGELDSCAVPRAKMFELLDPVTKEPVDPKHKTIKQIIPALSMDTNQFSFVTRNISVYMGTGTFPNGIPIDFFNNTHARKAMAYSFNWSTYGAQAYFGESDYRKNYLVLGLYPDYYNDGAAPGYYESLAKAEEELKQAYYVQDSVNKSLWDWGFYFDLTFNTGNDVRNIACQMVSSFFDVLSTYDERSEEDPPFTVFVKEITWTNTIRGMVYMLLPMYDIGWLADFADADNFARTYMHSGGTFAYFSKYRATNGWGSEKDVIVDTAVLTDDSTPAGKAQRQALYDELALMYYNDVPSFPVNNPRGRRFCQYWVKGWYYDALYPSQYYYALWKADHCWFDVSGTPIGISDGKLDMKDIAYLILHFNAKAPVPGKPTDPKWVGVYGANGGVDSYGDRVSNMKDIAGAIQHFGHKQNTGTP